MGRINHNTSFPNDGLGDALRDAFTHQNTMNEELYDTVVFEQTGKDLSTNDFTDALKTKLLGIEDGAEVNVQSDWSQSDNTADDYIKNKPTLNNYVNTIGFFDYNNGDTTPLTLVANTEKKLENDCVGAYTNIDHPTHGVTRLFDPTTNNIVLDELGVGDLVKLRVDINITTATANQVFKCILRLGIGTANQFDIIIHEEQIKDTGAHQRTIFTGFYVGSEEVRLALGELVLVSDHAGSVVVNGFFFEGIKRNVNFVELSGGGGITTPTLQEVLIQGNEFISTDGLNKVVFDEGGLYYYVRATIGSSWVKVSEFGQAGLGFNLNDFFGTGIKGEFNPFVGFKIYDGTNEIIITPTSATKNGVEFATIDDIPTTATELDALKRDGSNANSDVDLGTTHGIRAGGVTIQNNGTDKSMKLLATNMTNERTAEWQDKEYTGIADISDITSALATFKTTEFLDATSSIQGQLDAKQNKISWISSSSPYTGTSSTALQKLSNTGSSGNGSFPAKANTRYKIEVQFVLSGLSTTNNNIYFGILGTVGITSVNGISTASKSSTLTGGVAGNQVVINTATISQVLATTNTNTYAKAIINLEVVTSTAGTLIVAFATNVSTTPVVENHIIRFIELGTSSSTSSSDIV